ncbi:Phytanoyl-CoA dioxygenase (PhyH) [compost metagenome]
MKSFQLTKEQIADYHRDGYVICKGFLSEPEADKLYSTAIADDVMINNAFDLDDQQGKKTKLSLWYTPGDDVYGFLARSERIVNAVDLLLDGSSEVCHFHTKLMQKEPKIGGAWEWHQDYGYWYKDEFLFPNQLISVMTAITEATKENGCLQVLKGSHQTGRFEHFFVGEQRGADMHYVNLALKHFELVHVELKPGDVLFFHSNLLHTSAANDSDNARWSLISCYNRAANIGYKIQSKSATTPIVKVPDNALLEWESTGLSSDNEFKESGV